MIFDTSILILVPKLYRKGHTGLVILFFKRTQAVRFYQKTIIFTMTSQSYCHYVRSTRGLTHSHPLLSPKNPCTQIKKIPVHSFLAPYTKFCTFVIGVLMPDRGQWTVLCIPQQLRVFCQNWNRNLPKFYEWILPCSQSSPVMDGNCYTCECNKYKSTHCKCYVFLDVVILSGHL